MNFVFLMDPLEKIIYEKDTTFIFMRESFRRKHRVFYLSPTGIIRNQDKTFFQTVEVKPQSNKDRPFERMKSIVLAEDDVHAVFVRTDPPFNERYLVNMWMLDLLSPRIFVINNPSGIRTVNEKIWVSQFHSLIPPTLIASDKDAILQFILQQKTVVAKPTNGYGGKSVFRISHKDSNMNVIIETLTGNFTEEIIVQQYIRQSQLGDKRILLLNGEPLGAVMRVHSTLDHRNNFFSGGKPEKTEITSRDLQIIRILRPHLQALGLHFVGIDIIGKYLIEVNVTSPTCAQEINRLYNLTIEKDVIDYVERNVHA